jgi:hypothetical protein
VVVVVVVDDAGAGLDDAVVVVAAGVEHFDMVHADKVVRIGRSTVSFL